MSVECLSHGRKVAMLACSGVRWARLELASPKRRVEQAPKSKANPRVTDIATAYLYWPKARKGKLDAGRSLDTKALGHLNPFDKIVKGNTHRWLSTNVANVHSH